MVRRNSRQNPSQTVAITGLSGSAHTADVGTTLRRMIGAGQTPRLPDIRSQAPPVYVLARDFR